ncbi:MAG: 3-dehydroquinate synthase [Anaerotardibacter sp.]
MTKIEVEIPNTDSYVVRIAQGALDSLGETLRSFSKGPKVLVITDDQVGPRYGSLVKETLEKAGFFVSYLTIPSGEESKSVALAEELWCAMAQCQLDRNSTVVALGGGVVGDLAGFTGSTFMRGLSIVQVPTTLLSMVDSSVGGKTAINLEAGKNLVGTFCQPKYVCADLNLLTSLSEREWACGCGEIAKSALIDSDDFFFWLMENASLLKNRDVKTVEEAVVRSVLFKARVVSQDQCETKGVRECLNYGHTLAHAIETLAGYGSYSHGAAVAEGMRFAIRLAVALKGTSLELVEAQDSLLDSLGLSALDFKADPEDFLQVMLSDKKTKDGQLRFVLPEDVGKWSVETVDNDLVLEHLRAWQKGLAED